MPRIVQRNLYTYFQQKQNRTFPLQSLYVVITSLQKKCNNEREISEDNTRHISDLDVFISQRLTPVSTHTNIIH